MSWTWSFVSAPVGMWGPSALTTSLSAALGCLVRPAVPRTMCASPQVAPLAHSNFPSPHSFLFINPFEEEKREDQCEDYGAWTVTTEVGGRT